MVVSAPTVLEARAQFPALESGFAFLENAGGSQLPGCVIDAMVDFMRDDYVQTGAGYPASDRSGDVVYKAHEFCEVLMGAEDKGHVVLGASTTQLIFNLAEAFSRRLTPGDEVVVSVANHEANAGSWARLGRQGVVVKWWGVDPISGRMDLSELEKLLSPRTKVVAFPHTSNLLGNVLDVKAVTETVHRVGGRVVVDGVAFASHNFMEVAAWGVDFYVYSAYKVYGPHMAAMYGRSDAWSELEGANHFFVPRDEIPRKFELGCLSFEGCAAIVALADYLCFLAGTRQFDRDTVRLATARMNAFEAPVTERLMGYLKARPDVRIVGPVREPRVPTVSFVSSRVPSPTVAGHVNRQGIGIRHGHMYSYRLTEALGVDPAAGFVRVSAVHYNTVEEIDRLCEALEEVL